MFLLDKRAFPVLKRAIIQENDSSSLSKKKQKTKKHACLRIADGIQTQTESVKLWRTGVNLLDLTTAWVCADVPEAMLVRAQAASN